MSGTGVPASSCSSSYFCFLSRLQEDEVKEAPFYITYVASISFYAHSRVLHHKAKDVVLILCLCLCVVWKGNMLG